MFWGLINLMVFCRDGPRHLPQNIEKEHENLLETKTTMVSLKNQLSASGSLPVNFPLY